MAAPNERQPLLQRSNFMTQHVESLDSDSDESTVIDDSDFAVMHEPLEPFPTEQDVCRVSLGLADAVNVFDATLSRKSSITPALVNENKATTFQPEKAMQGRKHRDSSIKNGYGTVTRIGEGQIVESKYSHDVSDGQFRWIFLGMLFNWFVVSFDSTLMASSHPVITSYFNASSSASWLSTSFLITSTAFQPVFGRLSDTFGRKTPFLVCMIVFIVGTALCGLSQSIVQFILARAVCGLGAGGAMALGAIIITDFIPLSRRASYLAVLNIGYGVGAMLGAAIGGLLADALGWRWEFGIQVPPLLLCLLITGFNLPSDLGPCLKLTEGLTFCQTMKRFDMYGSIVLTLAVTNLILGLNLGGNIFAWTHPIIVGSFVCFAFFVLVFVAIERRVARPIMPLYLITRKPHINLLSSNFFVAMTCNSLLFNVPLYFQGVLLDTPTKSGMRLIIPFILSMFASSTTGYVMNRTQKVLPCMATGVSLIVTGTACLTLMPRTLPSLAFSFIMGIATIGQGLNIPTYSIGVQSITLADETAVAMSTLLLFRNLGNVLGIAFSSLVSQSALAHYLTVSVNGDDAASVIAKVRQSVELIPHLALPYREQVVDAYAATMRWTFGQCVVTAVVASVLIVGVKLPQLSASSKEQAADVEA